MPLDLAHLRSWIGREQRQTDLLTPRLLAGFQATLGPHLADGAAAAAPGLHWCLAPEQAPPQDLGRDGHPRRGGFLPPVPWERRMWAGSTVELLAPLNPGAAVERLSTIADVTLKNGRQGDLCLVTINHEYRAAGTLAVREQQTLVYRDDAAGPPQAAAAPAERRPHDLSAAVDGSATLLFRYSALTFNGHRIHYDQEYAAAVEGYAGLVVHGPLQATLAAHLAMRLAGAQLRAFSFRGVAPLTAGPFMVAARRAGAGIVAWTERPDGAVCLEVRAAV